jgi:hypothetical protein
VGNIVFSMKANGERSRVMQWFSTGDLVRLLRGYFPLTTRKVREWCESGTIPVEHVRRTHTPHGQGHWFIAAPALDIVLALCELSPDEAQTLRRVLFQNNT